MDQYGCPVNYDINRCSSQEYGLTCETCWHMEDRKGRGTLISAKEARSAVEQGTNEKATEQMEQIEWEITDAVNNGRFSVGMDGVIERANRIKLEELGYQVSTGSQYNESYFSISW